jgi:hypothetical protein
MKIMDALHECRFEPEFEVRFQSLFDAGRAFTFPCDAAGRVDLDRLSERALQNYFYARAVVGREFSPAAVVPHTLR